MFDTDQDRLEQQIDTQRERIRQLEDLLVPASTIVPREWFLTAKEARVFAHLTTRDVATKRTIMQALYFDQHTDDEPQEKIVDVFVCKIRKKLVPYGVVIETVWGQGYTLKDRQSYVRLAAPIPRDTLRDLLEVLQGHIQQGEIDHAQSSITDLINLVGEPV